MTRCGSIYGGYTVRYFTDAQTEEYEKNIREFGDIIADVAPS